MITLLQTLLRRGVKRGRTLALMFGLALLSLAAARPAWAHDDDENMPLDPQAKAVQLWAYGILAVVIVLFASWYWLRRRRILRGDVRETTYRNDD